MRLDGRVATLSGGVMADECVALGSGKRYPIEGGRFVLDEEQAEFVLINKGQPVLYGAVDRAREVKTAFNDAKQAMTGMTCREQKPCKEEPIIKSHASAHVPEFYLGVKPALDEMFTCYPEEEGLTALIPDSDWVRVSYGARSSYVIGLMRTAGQVEYICYGVPGNGNEQPPEEMRGACQWIPVPSGTAKGYWMVFQDAKTGETVRERQ